MKTIVINTENDEDLEFWLSLVKKTGTNAITLDTEEMENAIFAGLIEKGLNSKSVSRETILKSLRK